MHWKRNKSQTLEPNQSRLKPAQDIEQLRCNPEGCFESVDIPQASLKSGEVSKTLVAYMGSIGHKRVASQSFGGDEREKEKEGNYSVGAWSELVGVYLRLKVQSHMIVFGQSYY